MGLSSRTTHSPLAAALSYLERKTASAKEAGELVDWFPDRNWHTTSAGRTVVHLYQHYRGIPVFEAMQTVTFAPGLESDRDVHGSEGKLVSLAENLPLVAELDAESALVAACRELAPRLAKAGKKVTAYPPSVQAILPLPAQPTILHKRPFRDPVLAHLVVYLHEREARLCWFLSLSLPATAGAWEMIIDAAGEDRGRVLECRDVVSTAVPAHGEVWPYEPDDPGAPKRRARDFPVPLTELPPIRPRTALPPGFPVAWVDDRGTAGNNAEVMPQSGSLLRGTPRNGVVHFSVADDRSRDQGTLNAFFWCNYVHDLFFLLGFDEVHGNFQRRNFSGRPGSSDRVKVRIVGRIRGDASFLPAQDGTSPRLSLGRTVAGRHTSLSADVVIHELIHGVTNRLVGGTRIAHPMAQSFQSKALDEGLCDYFALTIQNHTRLGETPPLAEKMVFGAWVAKDDTKGLRPHSYHNYPRRFGDLRTVPELREKHAAGQVWCAALLEMNASLGQVVGDLRRGHEIGWQIVVDALQTLSAAMGSITFLNLRSKVLDAVTSLDSHSPLRMDGSPLLPPQSAGAAAAAVAAAFARFGMGPLAVGSRGNFEDAASDPP